MDEATTIDSAPAPLMNEACMNLCLEATWEIDALVRLLPDLVPNIDVTTSAAQFAIRGIATRIVQLNNAVMSGLGDFAVDEGDLRKIVQSVGTL